MTARRCRGCGRRLHDPASIAAGLGPVCRARLTGPARQGATAMTTQTPTRAEERQPQLWDDEEPWDGYEDDDELEDDGPETIGGRLVEDVLVTGGVL